MNAPSAAPPVFPFKNHRTMAQVMADEAYYSPFAKIDLRSAPSGMEQAAAGWRRSA